MELSVYKDDAFQGRVTLKNTAARGLISTKGTSPGRRKADLASLVGEQFELRTPG